MRILRAWWHRRWPQWHRFSEAFKFIDAAGNCFIGVRCRCGVVDDRGWKLRGSIFPGVRGT